MCTFSAAAGHQRHLSLASVHSKDSIVQTNFESIILQDVGRCDLARPVCDAVPICRVREVWVEAMCVTSHRGVGDRVIPAPESHVHLPLSISAGRTAFWLTRWGWGRQSNQSPSSQKYS